MEKRHPGLCARQPKQAWRKKWVVWCKYKGEGKSRLKNRNSLFFGGSQDETRGDAGQYLLHRAFSLEKTIEPCLLAQTRTFVIPASLFPDRKPTRK